MIGWRSAIVGNTAAGGEPRQPLRLRPSWYAVATSDNAIPPDAERHMAKRAGAQTIEVDASHSIALSQPKAVADLIRTAVNATKAVAIAS